jgi:hypothetical protein
LSFLWFVLPEGTERTDETEATMAQEPFMLIPGVATVPLWAERNAAQLGQCLYEPKWFHSTAWWLSESAVVLPSLLPFTLIPR